MSTIRQFSVGFLAFVMAVTALAGVGINTANAAAGDLVKSSTSSTVYVVDADGVTLHLFPNAAIFESWNYSFDNVNTVDLSSYTMGSSAEARSGSLLKSFDQSAVYYIEDGTLRPIVSETVFYALGLDFGDVFETSQAFVDQYPMGTTITDANLHVKGQLIKYASDSAVYLIGDGNTFRAFQSESAFYANRLSFDTVLTIPDTEVYTAGAMVSGFEHGISTPMGVAGGPVAPPAGSNVTVSLDPSSPAATTIVVDGSTHSQALIPFVSVRFTAPVDGSVTVNTLRFKRTGISSDSDVSETYLYSGMERVAFGGSLSSNYVTFNDASGLFTLAAGESKVITLRLDLIGTASAGKTMAFQLESVSDVTTNAGVVSGSFPAMGATMTTAQASDLGYATISGSYTTPTSDNTSVDADEQDFELWKFSLTANDQDLSLKSLRFTKVGSIDANDLQNFRLVQGGTEVASLAMMNDNFELFFDLSSNPFAIDKGETKVFSLRGDIVEGSSRDFKFTFQYADDLMIEDTAFGVYVPAALTIGNSWTVVQPTGDYLVGTGSLSISKATDSPTGDISLGGTNVHLARYEIKATGEDVKIKDLRVAVDTSSSGSGLDNGVLKLDGVQIGSTTDFPEFGGSTSTITFGSSFIAKVGQTHILDVYADAKTTSGGSLTNSETVKFYLYGTTSLDNATGQSSLTTLDAPDSDKTGNSLTVSNASLSFFEYTAVADQTLLAGTNAVKIAAFQALAGSSEDIDLDGITITASSTEAGYISNLKLMVDGVQVGTTKANPSTSNLFSVSVNIPKGTAKIVEVWADLDTGATGTIELGVEGTGTGFTTGNSVTAVNAMMQAVTIGTGTLDISVSASTPESGLLIAPSTGQVAAKFKFDATNSSFEVHELTLAASSTDTDSVSLVTLEYPLADGTTGTAMGSFGATGVVTFYLNSAPMYVAKDDDATLTVKLDIASTTGAGGADNSDAPTISIDVSGTFKAIDSAGTADTDATTGGAVTEGADLTANAQNVYKAYPTVAFASDTPSGDFVPSTNTLLAKIQITATGGDDVTFENADGNSLTFQLSSSGAAAGSWDDAITFKDDQGNVLWSTTTDLSSISEFTADFATKTLEVGQGTSEVIYVYVDTSEFASTGENLQLWLDDTAGDIDWGINNSGSYNHGDIIFRGDIFGGAFSKS